MFDVYCFSTLGIEMFAPVYSEFSKSRRSTIFRQELPSLPMLNLLSSFICFLMLGFPFKKWPSNLVPGIMTPLWQTFISSLEVYQLSSIHGCENSYSGRFDSDGGEKSLDTFVIQVIECHSYLKGSFDVFLSSWFPILQ